MPDEFEKLETEVERQLVELNCRLRTQPAPGPSESCLARIKTAVAAEAARLRRRETLCAALRPWLGIAAALLLVLCWSLPRAGDRTTSPRAPDSGPEATLEDWVAAVAESSEQVAWLLAPDWPLGGLSGPAEEDYDATAPLESLERSFESLEQVTGA